MGNMTKEQAELAEIATIAQYKSLSHENGYNVCHGGNLPNVKGEDVNTSILTEEQVKDIISRRDSGEMQKHTYADYETIIGYSAFQQIWLGNNWKYLQPDRIEVTKGAASLSVPIVKSIKKDIANGMKTMDIANKYNYNYKKIYNIKAGITYNYITI